MSLPLRIYGMYEMKLKARVSTWDIPVHAAFFSEPRVLFMLYLKSVKSEIVAHPICSSLISLKRGMRALFLLGADFHTNKIILLYHNRDIFTAAFTYVKRSFRFLIVLLCKISHQLSAVWRFSCLRNIGTFLPQLYH